MFFQIDARHSNAAAHQAANRCKAMGKTLATRRSKTSGEEDGIRFVTPDELLGESDADGKAGVKERNKDSREKHEADL